MTDNTKWLPFEVANNEATFEIDEIYDTYAIGGVDLSSTTDLTCATCLVVKGDTKYVLQQYFIPSQYIERRIKDDKIPYDIWNERGYVTICERLKSKLYRRNRMVHEAIQRVRNLNNIHRLRSLELTVTG